MNKRKMYLVYCDIIGTYEENLTYLEKRSIFDSLEQLKNSKGCEMFIFCFCSTLEISEIEKYLDGISKEFPEYFENIYLGRHMGCDGYIHRNLGYYGDSDISKASSMIESIKIFDEMYDIEEIMYIDDAPNINGFLLYNQLKKSGLGYIPLILLDKNGTNEKFLGNNEYSNVYISSSQGNRLLPDEVENYLECVHVKALRKQK